MLSDELEYHVNEDVPCAKCGYNVRGIDIASRCPECGAKLTESLLYPILDAAGHTESENVSQWHLRVRICAHLARVPVSGVEMILEALDLLYSDDDVHTPSQLVRRLIQVTSEGFGDSSLQVGLIASGLGTLNDVGRVCDALIAVKLIAPIPWDFEGDFPDVPLVD